MSKLSQYLLAAILCCLVLAMGLLHAKQRWPADNYNDAMAKGQFDRARQFLAAEVAEGNPQAQTALANLHYLGLGGETDFKAAARLYHAAASEAHAAAQLNLGHLYKQGLGVNKDRDRAFGWYIHASIANNPLADYYLTQISLELTITPLQMSTLKERWHTLDALASEEL